MNISMKNYFSQSDLTFHMGMIGKIELIDKPHIYQIFNLKN